MNTTSVMRVRIARKALETPEICTFDLVSLEGAPLQPFSAGSHIDVHVAGLIRQYSLCNCPDERHRYQIAVLRDPQSRGGSNAMHDLLQEGQVIEIALPRNHFALTNRPAPSILFAGGIGVTPILCMAERLANIGAPFEMHYCTRSAANTAFRNRILEASFAAHAHFHFDDGAPEQRLNLPALLANSAPDSDVYVCGPGGFIDYVVSTAKANGWASDRIHFEHFGTKVQDTSADSNFLVRIASTGATYDIPAGKTVANVLAENGVGIPLSCEQGVCGTCVTRVLAGTPDHRDQYFTEDELARNDQFTPCCSRSKSAELVLDL